VGELPSGFVIVVLWVLGAVFALCGALCYAELAGALPRSGGEYNFLSRIYHPSIGFMAGVVSATVGFAAPVALAAMAFAQYLRNIIPEAPRLPVSFAVVIVVTGAHVITIGSSKVFQNVFTVLKLALILAFIVSGFLMGPGEPIGFLPAAGDGALIASTPFAIALMFVMYSYSGWNASTYIIGEVRDPARDVPWSLIVGTLLVGALYVALNVVFLKTTPIAVLAGKIDVGNLSAAAIFGGNGGAIMSGFICAGLISSISAMTWAGPRVCQTIGEDFPTLRALAFRTAGGIPVVAVLVQFAIVAILLATATFEDALIYAQFALVFCGLITVAGVVVLRVRAPGLARPFRCWGYPATPAIFALVALFTLAYTAREKPGHAWAGVATLAGALGLYYAGRWVRALRGRMR
jgi:APA family basic amino acid/polyamine antiporter